MTLEGSDPLRGAGFRDGVAADRPSELLELLREWVARIESDVLDLAFPDQGQRRRPVHELGIGPDGHVDSVFEDGQSPVEAEKVRVR